MVIDISKEVEQSPRWIFRVRGTYYENLRADIEIRFNNFDEK